MNDWRRKYLQKRGWYTYYNENYWVHPKTVARPGIQDYTNYGMTVTEAMRYEKAGCPKFPLMGLPGLSRIVVAKILYPPKGQHGT